MDARTHHAKLTIRWFKDQDWSMGATVRRYPVTLAIGAIITVFGLITEGNSRAEMSDLMARFAMTWVSLKDLQLWTIPISTFMQSDPGFPWLILFFSVTSLFALETLAGSAAALATWAASDWISSPLTAVALRVLAAFHNSEAHQLLSVGSTGSSAAFHGCYAAGAMLLPRKWSRRLLLLFVGIVVFQFAFERLDNSIAHGVATAIGLVLGRYYQHASHEKRAAASPHPEP